MDFVDDVDLILAASGGDDSFFAKLADVVNTSIRGGVNLNDVEVIIFDLVVKIINGVSENAGHRGLASTAWPDEEVGVAEFVMFQGILKGSGDLLLPNYIGEFGGAVFAVKDFTAHRYSAASTAAQAA